jgi:hypothetical protein
MFDSDFWIPSRDIKNRTVMKRGETITRFEQQQQHHHHHPGITPQALLTPVPE